MKSLGYLISTLSVLMLGTVSWQATIANPELKPYLIGGVATSILGMLLRFLSYEKEKRASRDDMRKGSSGFQHS